MNERVMPTAEEEAEATAIVAAAKAAVMASMPASNWARAGVVANAVGQTTVVAAAITYILS